MARANVGPPLLPTRYNSNLQIVQGPGYVAIETEEIHDVRVIPTNGRPHPAPKPILCHTPLGEPRMRRACIAAIFLFFVTLCWLGRPQAASGQGTPRVKWID